MMDRPSTSTNPLFSEQDDDMSSFVTKNQLFGAQRALHQEQLALGDRIDNLAINLRQSENRTRDYFDNKLDEHKVENDARMDEIRALLLRSTSSTSSRRSRSSRHSDDTISGSSTPTSNTLRRVARQDRQANRNPLHDTDSQEHRHRQNQAAFAQAQERQRQRKQEQEERARQHQVAQDAEAESQQQQLREAQALEAQRALRDSSRAVADRGRQARLQQEALHDEAQERLYQGHVHRQVPRQDRQAHPQARQECQVHREQEDNVM